MRPSRIGAFVGGGLLLLGGALLGVSAAEYLSSPQPLDSFSGNVVFTVNGRLVQYPSWAPDAPTVLLVGAGLVVLAVSLILTALAWGPRRDRVY